MLTLNDGRDELWQWDTGRTLSVDADCSQVHFSNKVFGRSIDVDVTDGVAIIPDILLQTDKDLNVWAFVGTADNGYTKISKTFKVNMRNKPADYVFTPTDQTTLAELVEQIGNLDELTTEAKDNLVAAINEAAKSGGGGGSFSMRVDNGYIQYSTDGGASWNDLIATAELQGPQGPKGDTGPKGETGAQGPKGDTGAAGADGKSAYAYAVDGGFTGTEAEFAAKMSADTNKYEKIVEVKEITEDISAIEFTGIENYDDFLLTGVFKGGNTSGVTIYINGRQVSVKLGSYFVHNHDKFCVAKLTIDKKRKFYQFRSSSQQYKSHYNQDNTSYNVYGQTLSGDEKITSFSFFLDSGKYFSKGSSYVLYGRKLDV